MDEKPKPWRSGALAKAAGVSTDTLRHYERLGVLPEAPRTTSGYRVYPPDSLERVNIVRSTLRLGFTLPELAEVLRNRDRGGIPCKRVLGMLEEKLHLLNLRIQELQETQMYMGSIVGDWGSKIAESRPGKRAFLLHSLNGSGTVKGIEQQLIRRRQR